MKPLWMLLSSSFVGTGAGWVGPRDVSLGLPGWDSRMAQLSLQRPQEAQTRGSLCQGRHLAPAAPP